MLPHALFEVGFAVGCVEWGSAGGGISTLAGDTSGELYDPPVNPSMETWSHSGESGSTLNSWSPTSRVSIRSPRTRVWWSVASTPGTTQRKWLSGFTLEFLPFLMKYDDCPGWRSSNRFFAQFSCESTAGGSFNNWAWTRMSKSQVYTAVSSVLWVVPFAVLVTEGSFDFWNRFLLLRSRVTFTHNMKCTSWKHSDFSLALCRSCPKRRRILLTELGLNNPWHVVHILVQISLTFSPRVKPIRWIFLRMLERLVIADLRILSAWLQV